MKPAMAITSDFQAALASEEPREGLRQAVAHELEGGTSRENVLAQLEQLRADLRARGREDDEDVVLEVMDFVTGFCSPHMRL
jgi:hypothetical protein